MNAGDLLVRLRGAGLQFKVSEDGRLLVRPATLLTTEDRADLTVVKKDLVALLHSEPFDPDEVCLLIDAGSGDLREIATAKAVFKGARVVAFRRLDRERRP